MRQNLAIVALAVLLMSGLASRLLQGSPAALPSGPRAPEYTKGWQLAETSTAAPAAAAAPTAIPAPAPVSTVPRLDALWASSDWEGVIALLEAQQWAATPIFSNAVLQEKLYAAQVNAGHTMLKAGNVTQAQQYYRRAIAVDPARPEAPDAIRSVEQAPRR